MVTDQVGNLRKGRAGIAELLGGNLACGNLRDC
jgi:hypothetical protein